MSIPRGIRNNNPGNIEAGDQWVGLAAPEEMTDAQREEQRFAVFRAPEWGIRAMVRLLLKYKSYGLNTVAGIIGRWAPPGENATGAYAAAVAAEMGVEPDAVIDVEDPATMRALVTAIIRHENGQQPYPAATIDRGLELAGLELRAPIEESRPVFERPAAREEKPVSAIAASVLASVVPKLLELLPWFTSGSRVAERNIKAIEAITPTVIEAARRAAGGGGGALESAEVVLVSPDAQRRFIAEMAERWDDVRPMLEFEEESRGKARSFARAMTDGDGWRAIGFGLLLAALSLIIVVGGGWVLFRVLMDAATPPEQKGMILGAMVASVTTVVAYFFGSSAGSKRAGDAVRQIAERRG